MTRLLIATMLALVIAGCGGSPTAPVPSMPASGSATLPHAGAYELTFAASPNCNRDWWGPVFVPSRTYQTTFSGTGGVVYLTPGVFASSGSKDSFNPPLLNAIYFSIDGDFVKLWFEDPYIEELNVPGIPALQLYGYAEGRLTDPVTELKMWGDFADCDANGHTLTLRRINP